MTMAITAPARQSEVSNTLGSFLGLELYEMVVRPDEAFGAVVRVANEWIPASGR